MITIIRCEPGELPAVLIGFELINKPKDQPAIFTIKKRSMDPMKDILEQVIRDLARSAQGDRAPSQDATTKPEDPLHSCQIPVTGPGTAEDPAQVETQALQQDETLHKGRQPLKEIEQFDISGDLIELPKYSKNLLYYETDDQRLFIVYNNGKIYTTWPEVLRLCKELPADFIFTGLKLIHNRTDNRASAIRMFLRAVRDGLRPGQIKKDPDADLRPVLNQSSALRGDFGDGQGDGGDGN